MHDIHRLQTLEKNGLTSIRTLCQWPLMIKRNGKRSNHFEMTGDASSFPCDGVSSPSSFWAASSEGGLEDPLCP